MWFATELRTGGYVVLTPVEAKDIFSKTSREALGPTQPPIQWVPGSFSSS